MNITDEMLYQAAPEAAERWLATLPGREDCTHEFSLTFEAAMQPLLKKRVRRWKTLVLLAAVIAALASLAAFGVSANRLSKYGVYVSQEDGFVSYLIRPKEDSSAQELHQLTPAWLPEGLALTNNKTLDGYAAAEYRLHGDSWAQWLKLEQWHNGEANSMLAVKCTIERTKLDGEEAVFISSLEGPYNWLLWTRGNDAFLLSAAGLEREDIFRFAESLEW